MDPICVAHVADELQRTDPALGYDEAAELAAERLQRSLLLQRAARSYSRRAMGDESFRSIVARTR